MILLFLGPVLHCLLCFSVRDLRRDHRSYECGGGKIDIFYGGGRVSDWQLIEVNSDVEIEFECSGVYSDDLVSVTRLVNYDQDFVSEFLFCGSCLLTVVFFLMIVVSPLLYRAR